MGITTSATTARIADLQFRIDLEQRLFILLRIDDLESNGHFPLASVTAK